MGTLYAQGCDAVRTPTFLVGLRGHEALLNGIVVQCVAGQAVQPRRSELHAPTARELLGTVFWSIMQVEQGFNFNTL